MKSTWWNEIVELTEEIFNHPELGYEEWNTRLLVMNYVKKVYPEVEFREFARTGFSFQLPGAKQKKLKMAYIAELDAVFLPSHFNADKSTGAAHVCGHYTQVGIALALFRKLMDEKIYESFHYGIGFVFVPAEEYLDLEHRKELRKRGEIQYLGGKPEAMRLGVFDDYDFALMSHAMGGKYERPSVEFLSHLDGFLYKYYKFLGKASHAGFAPWEGVNALSMGVLFHTGVGLLRQQIDESKMVRINPVFLNTSFGTNVIADQAYVGTDLRSNDVNYMLQLAEQLDCCARGCAEALGGSVEIETEMGYLPFRQDSYLSQLGLEFAEKYEKEIDVYRDRPIAAAGDIGDLSFLIPCIQIGYSGFSGTIHGADFVHQDLEYILEGFPNFLVGYFQYLSENIDGTKFYRRSFEEYERVIQTLGGYEHEK